VNGALQLLEESYVPNSFIKHPKFFYKAINAEWYVENILCLCSHPGISLNALFKLRMLDDGETLG
jgi:hypothetical protein